MHSVFRWKLAAILLLALCAAPAARSAHVANTDVRFRTYNGADGLSQQSVYCVLQDRRGFIWVGTQDGLNRFDSRDFLVFRHDPADSASITDNSVHTIAEDDSGRLWVGTNGGGVNLFDPSSGSARPVPAGESEGRALPSTVYSFVPGGTGRIYAAAREGLFLADVGQGTLRSVDVPLPPGLREELGRVNDVALTGDTLWLATYEGLLLYDTARQSSREIRLPNLEGEYLSHSYTEVELDSRGLVWVGSETQGLYRLDREGRLLRHYTYRAGGENCQLYCNHIRDIHEDSRGQVWIGTRNGLLWYDRGEDRLHALHHRPTDPQSLPVNDIRSIFEDRSGNLWVGTNGGGLAMSSPHLNRLHHLRPDPLDPNSLAGKQVHGLARGRGSTLWVGLNGEGLDRVDLATGEVRHLTTANSGLPTNRVWSILEQEDGTLWVGTFGGGLARRSPDGRWRRWRYQAGGGGELTSNYVGVLAEGPEGDIWAGTFGGGVQRIQPSTGEVRHYRAGEGRGGLPEELVRSFLVDRRGRIWAGTDGGPAVYDPEADRFQPVLRQPGMLASDRVLSLLEDSRGRVWVGLLRAGINVIAPDGTRSRHIGEVDGLANNVVYCLLEDREGKVWAATNRGLSHIDPRTWSITNYNAGDGLQADEFNQGAWTRDEEGWLFLGGVNGVTFFHPDSLPASPPAPPVVVTEVQVLGQRVPFTVSGDGIVQLRQGWRENHFSFRFVALDFANPGRSTYSYRLEGVDQDWQEGGKLGYAAYTDVAPGSFRFDVRTADRSGRWLEGRTLARVQVDAPFWKTAWFRILAFALGFGLVIGVSMLRTHALRRRSRMLSELVEERTGELRRALAELERAKDAEMEAQQLKVVNQLAATIAHEFNNPLAIIRGYAELTEQDGAGSEELRERMERIHRQTDRMGELVRRLLRLRHVRERDYAGTLKILDLESASPRHAGVAGEVEDDHDPA